MTRSAPRLTIAIPTYNRAELLKSALDSALSQTSRNVEIIVSDNGSSDGTQALLEQYDDPRLSKFRHERTVTRAEHGTFIFSEVKTELVLILSDDDYLEPEFAAEVIRLFDEHPEISFAYTGCIEHFDDEKIPALVGPRVESTLDFFSAYYAGKRQVEWCACVTRVWDILECGPQPGDRIMGDLFFWKKIAFKGPIGCVTRPLSHYTVLRPQGDNESRTAPIVEWGNEMKLLTEEVMQNVRKSGAGEEYQQELARNMQSFITRTIASQFIWTRISGADRRSCLTLVLPSLRFNGWTFNNLFRVFAAIILPASVLRFLIVKVRIVWIGR